MEEAKIIKAVSDALTGKMIYEFTIQVRHIEPVISPKISRIDKFLRKEQSLPVLPQTERTFQIWPCVVSNQYRIAAMAYDLPKELFDDSTETLSYVTDHLPKMIYIIAAAVQNNHLEPDRELIQFFERNLDNLDIVQILAASLQATNMQSFSISIALMNREAAILTPKASPQDGSE